MKNYVHGYTEREAERLKDQANTLDTILHHDSIWPDGSLILEAGCGVGSQTTIISAKNPSSQFVSIDISNDSIAKARETVTANNIKNVEFKQADIYNLTFNKKKFNHILVCFVLEHLPDPVGALEQLKEVLKPGGTITVIEGDHGSAYFSPDSSEARKAIQCQVELQKRKGGDANIGRRIFPLLKTAGFYDIVVSPRMVYVDDSKPELVEGFTKNTFTAMIEGIKSEAVNENLISEKEMTKGISDLYRTTLGNGTFCYTFFKGIAIKK